MAHDRQTLTMVEPLPDRDDSRPAVAADLTPERMLDVIRHRGGGDQIETAVVEEISPDGVPTVVLTADAGRREASSLLQYPSAAAASKALLGRTVLVLVTRSGRPAIIGVLADRLWEDRAAEAPAEAELTLKKDAPVAVHADKRRIDLEASEEIRLTCGKSSLVMRRDGTVVVRGVTITSRASQSNKIRGGTVSVN